MVVGEGDMVAEVADEPNEVGSCEGFGVVDQA